MSYLEKQKGIDAGDTYSPTFLELDAESGPWLVKVQQETVIRQGDFPTWDLDLDNGVITFGNEQRTGIAARFQILGTYSADDATWLWSWSHPELSKKSEVVARVRDEHPDVPEFSTPTFACSEIKAWSLAAAAAHAARAESCYRLPGDVGIFVALFEITELDPKDPRAQNKSQDPELARQALAEFAGPAALNVGGLLLDALRSDEVPIDEVIAALHAVCDNLTELSQSPVGEGTDAALEAEQLAGALRQGALAISVPPGTPALEQGAREVLALLQHVAKRFDAWPEQEQAPED